MDNFKISCICGLGNPGREYSSTKHNIGSLIVEYLASHFCVQLTDQFNGKTAPIQLYNRKVHLFIPGSYMNLNGKPIRKLLDFYKIPLNETIIIHDELELPFGTWQIRFAGGNAGHNGLRSIENECGSKDFYRIRAGIGRPSHGDVSSWVLSKFSKDQEIVLPLLMESVLGTISSEPGLSSSLNQKTEVFPDKRR